MSAPGLSLTILGSGGALPVAGRYPSSQFLQIRNTGILIDAGEGAQVQMMRLGVSHAKVQYIFISHLHGDHYLGLMGLLFSMHLGRRTNDLHIYSHTGLEEVILLQLKLARSVLSYRIHFHHLVPGATTTILETDQFTVTAFPLRHRIPCSGFIFREKPLPLRMNKETLPEGMLLQHIALLKQGIDVLDEHGNTLHKV
ncbi:MAG: MBL fold metallo-hydrolase, partial [Bacteroidota bacterium]